MQESESDHRETSRPGPRRSRLETRSLASARYLPDFCPFICPSSGCLLLILISCPSFFLCLSLSACVCCACVCVCVCVCGCVDVCVEVHVCVCDMFVQTCDCLTL